VYARHGRELMGWKSPVREPIVFIVMDTNKSTSRRQGRLSVEGSEGSRSAYKRGDEHKKDKGARGQGKCGVCARKAHVLIEGDLFAMR
jgi:hypothetical protein